MFLIDYLLHLRHTAAKYAPPLLFGGGIAAILLYKTAWNTNWEIPSAILPVPNTFYKHQNTDGPWFELFSQCKKIAADSSKKWKIVFLGDSITYNWSKEGEEVWKSFFGEKRRAVNFGIRGDRTQHILWRIDHGNLDFHASSAPNLVVLMIGTNNLTDGNAPDEVAKGVKCIVEKIKEKLPKTKILILSLLPRNRSGEKSFKSKIYVTNSYLAHMENTKKGIYYLDISKEFLHENELSKEYSEDGLHLNSSGYKVFANALLNSKYSHLFGEPVEN